MTTAERTYYSVAETAKLVRAALKASFPGQKFSVRSNSYSGGASIDIKWTDGPTTKDVDEVTGQFSGATFDGMIDLKSYHTSIFQGQEVHFGADFIFTERKFSPSFLRGLTEQVCQEHNIAVPDIRVSDYDGSAHIDSSARLPVDLQWGTLYSVSDLVYRASINAREHVMAVRA